MKPLTSLPHTASAEAIAAAIREIQRRCRTGLCGDTLALGRLVRTQLDRAQVMAESLGLTLKDLAPSMQAWDDGSLDKATTQNETSDATVVLVDGYAIRIARMAPWTGTSSGAMSLRLAPLRGEG